MSAGGCEIIPGTPKPAKQRQPIQSTERVSKKNATGATTQCCQHNHPFRFMVSRCRANIVQAALQDRLFPRASHSLRRKDAGIQQRSPVTKFQLFTDILAITAPTNAVSWIHSKLAGFGLSGANCQRVGYLRRKSRDAKVFGVAFTCQ